MIFGSWTYSKDEVQLSYLDGKEQVELNDYSFSGIWDIMDVPGELTPGNYRMEFFIHIRRKTLFYTVILIIPTVLMAFLSMMVFYLPADASEKITLAISILLALVVFLLLVSKILPPTSSTIPLMAKYLLLTFVMNIITILVTVIIINVYFRGPTTHRMPAWVESVFLHFLPLVLLMKRPNLAARRRFSILPPSIGTQRRLSACNGQLLTSRSASPSRPYSLHSLPRSATVAQHQHSHPFHSSLDLMDLSSSHSGGSHHHPNCSLRRQGHSHSQQGVTSEHMDDLAFINLSPDAYKAVECIEYIAEHLKQEDDYKKVC